MLPKHKPWDDDGDFCGGGDHCVVDVEEVEIRPTGEYYHARPRNEVQLQPKEPALEDVAREQEAPGLWAALQDYIDTVEADLTYQLQPTLKIGTWSFFKLAHPPLPFAPLVGHLLDFVRATPAQTKGNGEETRESNYDTVLVKEYPTRKGIY
ncbi:hypothetical protein FRC11_001435, partial [Ceratobasidium sp. 423]